MKARVVAIIVLLILGAAIGGALLRRRSHVVVDVRERFEAADQEVAQAGFAEVFEVVD